MCISDGVKISSSSAGRVGIYIHYSRVEFFTFYFILFFFRVDDIKTYLVTKEVMKT